MLNTPRKNVSKFLHDIKCAQKPARLVPKEIPAPTEAIETLAPTASRNFWKNESFQKPAKIVLVLTAVAAGFYIFSVLNFKGLVSDKTSVIYKQTMEGKNALAAFNPGQAEKSFLVAAEETGLIRDRARNFGIFSLADLAGKFIPSLKELPMFLNNFSDLNQTNLAIAKEINYLAENGPKLAFHGGGPEIIAMLETLNGNLDKLIALSGQIKNESNGLQNLSPQIASIADTLNSHYLGAAVDLYKAKEWLEALIAVLKTPGEQHFLLIFQNPSEMRPAGGFIGSHADLTLENGSIKKIAVDDIYNADRQLNLKTVPPKQLQGITKNWGARDANWFFNFPTSAAKVVYFLENSDLYKNRSIKFFGAAAIDVNIIESLLDAIGPIELPEYRLTLTAKNFLEEVQREVEAGQDKKPGQNPKKILSKITPLLIEKLANLSDEAKAGISAGIREHLQNKDLMLYFKDSVLEDLAAKIGLAGEVFALPKDFSGDYLAVVNTNIAGGKTDAFINQKIILQSEIDGRGAIHDQLRIEKTHSGQNQPDWWYKIANKSFMKILVPPGARLTEIKNNYFQLTASLYDSSYKRDPDLQNIENSKFLPAAQAETGQEMGKAYFAAWFKVPAGTTKTLELKYDLPRRAVIQNGAAYQFIFDKQSGVRGSLDYSVTAPPGFVWKESNSRISRFQTDNPKAREVINLTLESNS